MTDQAERVGELADGGLDAVAERRDGAPDRPGERATLGSAVRDDDPRPALGLGGGPGASQEAAIDEEPGRRGRAEQVVGDGGLVDRGRGELPGADEAAAEVGPQAQAEAGEPLPVGRVAPEAGPQVARAVPGVG